MKNRLKGAARNKRHTDPSNSYTFSVPNGRTMSLKILTGSANPALAESISGKLGLQLTRRILERFPDGELHIELQESVRGHDIYLVQPTCPPVDEHLLELLLFGRCLSARRGDSSDSRDALFRLRPPGSPGARPRAP